MFQISIDKESINKMPPAQYDGQIFIIDNMSQVNAAVAALRKCDIVGFDTETRPSFKKGELHKTALIQLATPNECFLFRINKMGIPASLQSYLEDSKCVKVGISVHDDFHTMHRSCQVTPGGFVELQDLVKAFKITEMSLQKIYAILFGRKISKGQRLTNWEAAELTEAQRRYAAIDAWACIDIYDELKSNRFIPEQSPYYQEIINNNLENSTNS